MSDPEYLRHREALRWLSSLRKRLDALTYPGTGESVAGATREALDAIQEAIRAHRTLLRSIECQMSHHECAPGD